MDREKQSSPMLIDLLDKAPPIEQSAEENKLFEDAAEKTPESEEEQQSPIVEASDENEATAAETQDINKETAKEEPAAEVEEEVLPTEPNIEPQPDEIAAQDSEEQESKTIVEDAPVEEVKAAEISEESAEDKDAKKRPSEKKRAAPKAPTVEEFEKAAAKLEPPTETTPGIEKSPLTLRNIRRVEDKPRRQPKTGWL